MSHFSPYPAFVRINSTSAYGFHSQIIPCVPIIFAVGDGTPQFDLRGLALPVSIQSGVEDWVNVISEFFPPSYVWTDYVAFMMSTPTATPLPVASGSLGIDGTNATTGEDMKATQATFTFRTDEFGKFRIVLLDLIVTNFEKITNPADANVSPVVDYVTADETWMAGRDGGRPETFLQMSRTLNKKLRRSYRMN